MSNTEYCNSFRSCRIPLYQDFISQSDKGATASTLTTVGVNHTNIKCKYYSVWLRMRTLSYTKEESAVCSA